MSGESASIPDAGLCDSAGAIGPRIFPAAHSRDGITHSTARSNQGGVPLKTVLIIVFVLYGIPLFRLRYQWRSTVYRTTDWKINILPWFGRDTAALFTNRYFRDDAERAMARKFRLYLAGYFALLALVLWGPIP